MGFIWSALIVTSGEAGAAFAVNAAVESQKEQKDGYLTAHIVLLYIRNIPVNYCK